MDEEDSAGAPDEGRFIETTATSSESLEGHSVQQQSMQQPPLGDKSDVTASSAAGESTSARNTSVWQRLRGIGKQDKKVGEAHTLSTAPHNLCASPPLSEC